MKNITIIMLILTFLSCQTDKLTEKKAPVEYSKEISKNLVFETELINGLTFPIWLNGVWQNTYESNTNNFITYSFKGKKLTIRQGLNFQGKEKFIEPYKNFHISESSTDSTYLIELEQNKTSFEYEFKLQSVEWRDEKVLTYSIVKNGKIKRDHLKSCQLVLSKISEVYYTK